MNVGENTNGNERRFMKGVKFLKRGFILLKLKVIERDWEKPKEDRSTWCKLNVCPSGSQSRKKKVRFLSTFFLLGFFCFLGFVPRGNNLLTIAIHAVLSINLFGYLANIIYCVYQLNFFSTFSVYWVKFTKKCIEMSSLILRDYKI